MNCKYCGAETGTSDLFCPSCGRKVDAPQKEPAEAQAGNERCHADSGLQAAAGSTAAAPECDAEENPAGQTDAAAAADGGSSGSAPAEKPSSEPSDAQRTVVSYFTNAFLALAVMLLCAILIGAGTCIYSLSHTKSLEGQLRRANSDYKTAAAAVEELNTQLSDLQTELDAAQEENSSLDEQVSSLSEQVTSLEGDITQYQYDASSARQDADYAAGQIATLNETITGLETDLAEANEANDTLQSQNDSLQTENETLEQENTDLTDENNTYEEKVAFYDQYVVFVVVGDKNKYYHTYDCTDFTKKSFLAYSVKLAEQNGYTACPVCHPDTAATTSTAGTAGTTVTTGTAIFRAPTAN